MISEFERRLTQIQLRLHAYIYSLTRDTNDADDLFQQTSIVLWKKYDQFDPEQDFLKWAFGIARLEVMNFIRTRSRQKLYFSDELNLQLIEASQQRQETSIETRRAALDDCRQQLREKDREMINVCYGQPQGIMKMAEQLGRSRQSIHNSLKRIRAALFECIGRRMRSDQNREVQIQPEGGSGK